MALARVTFRFHGDLSYFLSPSRREKEFEQAVGATDAAKHIIESLGVPHTEIGRVTVNGHPVAFSVRLNETDHVSVFPTASRCSSKILVSSWTGTSAVWLPIFACSVSIPGTTAMQTIPYWRVLLVPKLAVLLTRDAGLLKRREVDRGYYVRNDKPHAQLREVSHRFGLHSRFAPFQRCMDCNGRLHSVPKEEVAELLPPHTRATKNEFSRCSKCGKIFWGGSHHARMLGWIEELTARAGPTLTID